MSQPVNVQRVVAAVREAVARGAGASATAGPVLLHGPTLDGNEGRYITECLETAWVSSAGGYVTRFERQLAEFTGSAHAVAVVNGTAALHVALGLAGVGRDDEVLVPALTFVATANAVSYLGAVPHFCDVELATLGLDPQKLGERLRACAGRRDGGACYNRQTGRRIAAVVPVHTFGHPADLAGLRQLADAWAIPMVEDAAESLGSYYRGTHTGRFGRLGILSFNGNKIITTGAGGAVLTDDADLAARARHVTTTAKLSHAWEYIHDEVGYNYRMPNVNAAIGCGQLERLPEFLDRKRRLAERYVRALSDVPGVRVVTEPPNCRSNYWLNTLVLDRGDPDVRDRLLAALNDAGLQSRPVWRPMHQLPMYRRCPRADLAVTEDLAGRVINVPSSAALVERTGLV